MMEPLMYGLRLWFDHCAAGGDFVNDRDFPVAGATGWQACNNSIARTSSNVSSLGDEHPKFFGRHVQRGFVQHVRGLFAVQ